MVVYTPTTNRNWQEYHFKYFKNYFEVVGTLTCPSVLLSGASNAIQLQALPRPQQKLHLFAAHEEGIGPRTLSRLTGVPYSIDQRATSDAVRYGSMVCESLPVDEEYETYIDDSEYEKYPEY